VSKSQSINTIFRILVGKLQDRRPLGRPRWRQDNNIRMDVREIGHENADWIHLAIKGV
jgi:hypothetical protein